MTVTIDFPAATLARLQAHAQAAGTDVESVVKDAVEKQLVLASLGFREILEPIHREVEASGVTEDDLQEFIESQVAAMRAESSPKRSQR